MILLSIFSVVEASANPSRPTGSSLRDTPGTIVNTVDLPSNPVSPARIRSQKRATARQDSTIHMRKKLKMSLGPAIDLEN
jgi:hypothetical protein